VEDVLPYFGAPYDIKSVAGGFVVADYAVGRLTKVADDPSHTRTTLAWGFDGPVGLADAGHGVFYVSEYDSGKITRVDTATNDRTPVLTGLSAPEGIALTPDGRLLIAETGMHRVLMVDPKGGTPQILADGLAIGLKGGTPAPNLFTGIAVAHDGAIYVTGDVDNVLYRLTPP
jgi:sugar lactone lactonase YvrE